MVSHQTQPKPIISNNHSSQTRHTRTRLNLVFASSNVATGNRSPQLSWNWASPKHSTRWHGTTSWSFSMHVAFLPKVKLFRWRLLLWTDCSTKQILWTKARGWRQRPNLNAKLFQSLCADSPPSITDSPESTVNAGGAPRLPNDPLAVFLKKQPAHVGWFIYTSVSK
jgi:hypothetical protein